MRLVTPNMRRMIQESMEAAFPEVEARVARLYAMQQYHLGWRDTSLMQAMSDPGKLLRPRLTLLACQAVGGQVEQALPLAAGIQLFHDFTLLHDDIQDVSATRRGRDTVWHLWGVAQAITAGDSMCALSHLAVHRLSAAGVPATRVLEVLQWFDETILAVCEGQYLDCSYEGNLDVTEDDYLAMIRRKTASLIGSAMALGGLVGGADSSDVQALYTVGVNLGMAFQVQDDLLGIWGDSSVTGKPGTSDLYRRKVSLPIIRAMRNPIYGAALKQIYRQATVSNADVEKMLEILDCTSIRSDMEVLVRHMAHITHDALDMLPEPLTITARHARDQIADTITELLPVASQSLVPA